MGAGEEGDNRGWDGWMASSTWCTWVWVDSKSWWWIGRPGVLRFMGSQRVRHDWATELNWMLFKIPFSGKYICILWSVLLGLNPSLAESSGSSLFIEWHIFSRSCVFVSQPLVTWRELKLALLSLQQVVLGKLDHCIKINEAGTHSHTIHKNKLKTS